MIVSPVGGARRGIVRGLQVPAGGSGGETCTTLAARNSYWSARTPSGWGRPQRGYGKVRTQPIYSRRGVGIPKAKEAGRRVLDLDPRHTSDRCEICDHAAKENRVRQGCIRLRRLLAQRSR